MTGAAVALPAPGRTSTLVTQISSLAGRAVLRTLRQPAMIVPSIVFPLFLLAVNSAGLGAATQIPGFPTDSYLTFVLAVPFVQGALFATMNSGQALAEDIENGFFNRLALTPMRGAALIAGQLGGLVVIGLIQATVYLSAGLAAGAHFEAGVAGVPVLFCLSIMISIGFGGIGMWMAIRTGSGEAVQGMFPLLFVFLFFSSISLPRDLIAEDWFRTVATINPVSYLIEGIRSLMVVGWDPEALALAFGIATALIVSSIAIASYSLEGKDGADMSLARSEYVSAALGIAWRSIYRAFTTPALLFPALIFPLFFLAAFAGGLSAVSETPAFDYPEGYTTFIFGFVLLQASALGGIFTGFSIAADFQFGMGRRMLLATRHRTSIIAGYVLTAMARVLVTWTVVTCVALLAGMSVGGNAADIVGLYTLSLTVNVIALLFAAGIALRLRTLQAGPLMQFPIFMLLFMSPVYVPQELLTGWISHVAKYNPITLILNTNRDFLAGLPAEVLATYGIALGLTVLMAAWGVSGMRSAEAAG